MPKPTPLAIDLLRIDGNTQSRLFINEDVVEDYAALIDESGKDWPFPPLDVFYDGAEYFVADGFHRKLGAQRAKRASIPCIIHKGNARDARIFGMTANDRHGLRMTRADKRACVKWLLDNGEKMTQKAIAATAGVGLRLVQQIVADRKSRLTPHQPPPVATKAHYAPLQPGGGEPDPFDEVNQEALESPQTAPEPETASESPPPSKTRRRASEGRQRGKGKPGKPEKQFDRSYWFKQWEQSIGPLVRLVDKIAEGIGEKHDPHHEAIQERLNEATEEMTDWLQVRP